VISRFGRDALVYGATTVLARGTAFLLIPIITRALTPEAVGFVELASVVIIFAQVVLSLEIGQALARYVPDAEFRGSTSTIASTALWFAVGSYLASSAVVIVAAGILFPAQSLSTTVILVAATAIGGLFLLVQGQLRWELRPRPYALTSVLYAAVTFVVTVGFLAATQDVAAVFVGQVAGASVGAIAVIGVTRATFVITFDPRWLRTLLAFSLPLVPASLGVLTALYIDRILLGILMDLENVAWFSIGHRLASTVGLVMTAVQLALTPLIYAAYRRSDAPDEISRAYEGVVGLVLLLWLGVALLAPELVTLFATAAYDAAASVVPILMPAIILSGMVVFAPGLWIERRTGLVAVISLGGAALNIVLNLILIEPFGIVGAALATLVSAGVVFGVTMTASQRAFPIPYPFLRSGLGVAIVAAAIVIATWSGPSSVPILARLAIGLVAAAGLLAVGVLRPRSWLWRSGTHA
jgi:O-antigen/teichoic acid export membrane protein